MLTPELQQEIRDLLAGEPKFDAYWIPRLNLYFGKWIRHGGFYPDHKLRLFKRGAARLSEGVGPHSTPQFAGPRGKLRGDMLHYAYPTMGIYLEHMNRYSSEIAELLHKRGKDSRTLPAFFVECGAEPSCDVCLQLFFSVGIFGWTRRTDSAHQSLGLYPLEVHQGVAAGAGERVVSDSVSYQLSVFSSILRLHRPKPSRRHSED